MSRAVVIPPSFALRCALEARLGARELRLYVALVAHMDPTMRCWPSVRTLGALTGMDERAVRRTLRALEERGFLETATRRRENQSSRSNLYRLTIPAAMLPEPQEEDPPTVAAATPLPGAPAPPLERERIERETTRFQVPLYERSNNALAGINGHAGRNGATDAGKLFDAFWAEYPRKVAKQRALKIWSRLHPTEQLAATIIAGVKRWQRSRDWTRGYIVHPDKFLAEARWEDEVPPDPNENSRDAWLRANGVEV